MQANLAWRQHRASAALPSRRPRLRDLCRCQFQHQHVQGSTDVDAAVLIAAQAIGQVPPEQMREELVQRLRDNWYSCAGEVAAMSMDEVQQMRIPVRLWAQLRLMLQQAEEAALSGGAGGGEQTAWSTEPSTAASTSTCACISPGTLHLQHEQQHQTQQTQAHALRQDEVMPGFVPATAAAAAATPADVEGDNGDAEQQEEGGSGGPELQAVLGVQDSLDDLPADIMQRKMPRNLHGLGAKALPEVRTRRTKLRSSEPYGLKGPDMSPELLCELERLQAFSCTRFAGQRVEPLKPVSFTAYKVALLLMLGWQHKEKGVPLEQLSLKGLLPSTQRDAVSELMEYQHWREQYRGSSPRSAVFPFRACIALARFLYHDLSKPTYGDKLPPYHDLDVVRELARLQRAANLAASKAPLVADESKKWLEWDEFLDVVRALRAECAGLTARGAPRSRKEVAASLQRYLIFAILSVIPDRQRTLRELEVGRTLVKDEDGRWLIVHGPDDYKTGKKYGERPAMVIPSFIYPELEAFIDTWRQEMKPSHPRLFSRPASGSPMEQPNDLRDIFVAAATRLTGRATNPHLVRDMIVTTLRNQGASDGVMDGLALFMGHSVKEQRSTYDRRTKAQKVAPAVQLIQGLNMGSDAGSQGRGA